MTTDTVPQQGHASHQLVRSLGKLPTSDLVRFTLQKPDVPRVFAASLNSLAVQAASSSLPSNHNPQLAQIHVDILTRLIERGDPSLARKFVPTQGSLIDLAVASPPNAKAAVASVLERLLDTTSAKEIIGGLSSQLTSVVTAQGGQDFGTVPVVVRTLARLSSAFLSVCPTRLIKGNADTLQKWAQTCIQIYDRLLPQVAKELGGSAADTVGGVDVSKLDLESWQLQWLTCRVDLLRLLSLLLDYLKGSSGLIIALRDAVTDTHKLLNKGGFSTLLNSTALLDLAATSDSWPSLRSELLSSSSAKKNNYEAMLGSIDTLATSVPKFTGAAWDALQDFVVSDKETRGKSPQQPARETSTVSEEILASVDSVLPHYGIDRLRAILSKPSIAGQSAEMVIQRLLEGDEGDAAPAPASSQVATPAVSQPSTSEQITAKPPPHSDAQPSTSSTPSLVKSRANVFGSFGFDPSTIVQPKLQRTGHVDDLAPSLKAAILARAEAADDEDEEEWNPFAEPHRVVGVEDELDLDYDGRERAPLRTGHDGEDEEGEMDDAKMRERVLLKHYVQYGSSSFAADVQTRKGEPRRRLKDQTGMSDDLVESWAVMLERNPKKDRLLAAASQSELDDQLRGRDDAEEEVQGGGRSWGPDRGRGGRILGGGRGGRGGGGRGGGGGGGGGASGGGHQGKNATRGRGTGNSATDRSAKQKEKAGNKARQKGHDKKMARVNP